MKLIIRSPPFVILLFHPICLFLIVYPRCFWLPHVIIVVLPVMKSKCACQWKIHDSDNNNFLLRLVSNVFYLFFLILLRYAWILPYDNLKLHHNITDIMSVRPDPNFKPIQETGPASGWARVRLHALVVLSPFSVSMSFEINLARTLIIHDISSDDAVMCIQ